MNLPAICCCHLSTVGLQIFCQIFCNISSAKDLCILFITGLFSHLLFTGTDIYYFTLLSMRQHADIRIFSAEIMSPTHKTSTRKLKMTAD